MKKITAFLAAAIMMLGCFGVSTFAADTDKTVTLRIEGKSSNYYYGKVETSATNVTDLLKQVDAAESSLTVTITSSSYGSYVTQINDDVAGSIAPAYYDGWSDMINGEAPSVGIDSQTIKDGDVVVFYYSDEYGSHGFAKPEADTSDIKNGIITFTSQGYDASYNPVTNPVEGLTVVFDSKTYTTDANGQIKVDDSLLTAGSHKVSYSKVDTDGMPLALRSASDYTITISEADAKTAATTAATTEAATTEATSNQDTKTGTEGSALYLVLGMFAVIVAGTVVIKRKTAYEK